VTEESPKNPKRGDKRKPKEDEEVEGGGKAGASKTAGNYDTTSPGGKGASPRQRAAAEAKKKSTPEPADAANIARPPKKRF
jgi:hypothetical protein